MTRRGEGGFTLIEVLVALAILAVSLTVMMQIFSESLHRARVSKMEMAAGAFAQSLLADVGHSVPLRMGDQAGELPGGFSWALHIEPYGSADDQKAWPMSAVSLAASVVWKDGAERHEMKVTTLRAVSKDVAQ